MISAFQSCKFGYSMELMEEQVNKVNRSQAGKRYSDKQAAINRHAGAIKKDIPNRNPFFVKFECGALNDDGYWNYEHLVLQLEDCVDVVKCPYPKYDFLFHFDHSCGHNNQREDELNIENMSKSYGGKQKSLWPTLIKEE